ncbi:hypothetical protein ACIQHV_18085 [Bacillus bombysepticus]|uniref:Uncharacterized protein n=1 Tax=Bacillus thuringiensis serovar kumamotoensis TaxID=132267 RepID=A0A9X6JIW3_BACUK|nr:MULTISPECIES: hypothetical protein [Bacillus cereus group]MBY0019805.1 hypothetical protein [Bacillus cereus]MEC2872258.1 hypothetical protein [Bacillus cereus]OTZ66705.1 hypothetical protein BK769_31540 [Bacillus thuringiensis serovar kumamtoensis]
MGTQELLMQLKKLERKVVQVETKVDKLKQTSIQKGDVIKLLYRHLEMQGEYLVEKIDNGVLELVAKETMKKIQE